MKLTDPLAVRGIEIWRLQLRRARGRRLENPWHSPDVATLCATVRDFLVIYLIWQLNRSQTTALGRIRVLSQLGHVLEERLRLADEKPHVR